MGLRLLVGTRFQVLFHSPPGVLFTFPSRYWCAIGRQAVFSLGRWSSRLPTGFPVPRGTRDGPWGADPLSDTGLSPSTVGLSRPLLLEDRFFTPPDTCRCLTEPPATPQTQRLQPYPRPGFGLFPVRSPLLRESRLISFPPGTKMFQFPWSRLPDLVGSARDDRALPLPGFPIRVSPGLNAC